MKAKLPDCLVDRLPKYEKIESIPQAFSDSTHHLWRLERSKLDQKNHFLKICSNTESPFWQIMRDLFDFDLRIGLANFADTYTFIDKSCSLEIPALIKAETLENGNTYILTSKLKGKAVSNINEQMITQLANHLAELHSNTRNTWGSLNNPKFNASDWSNRLQAVLQNSSNKWGGVSRATARQRWSVSDDDPNGDIQSSILQSDKYLKSALVACTLIETTEFVPMMPDLRWDQFNQQKGSLSALVDLDAFVYAPRELDFVILEYLLSADQINIFIQTYTKHHSIPEINQVREAYRLLLFYMQILGEDDLEVWMNKETLF